ncbi:protein MTSS 1-like isoform X4 [Cololabis saira]|uniref:protein MTSS 1-like isoform X4 n=1 Tax=Cololabis saira TaxID=129043 RepID=UPI002AD5A8F5|nr:protein MTSS 1-like isoform X4 [Cololabis saira]
MEAVIDRECSALGGLFQTLIGDMKSSYPIWEDFTNKAGKLQSQLRATVIAVAAFLDAFQKVADLATNSKGGTKDIGSALTRMCMRHRSIEAKLKQFSTCFQEGLINPLQEQMEEWKRGVNTLDKDHAKEYKRARQEIKKKSSDTLKLQKKAKKADNLGRGDIQPQLDNAMQDVSDKYILLEETEKQALRKALIEERQRFCSFVAMLRPVVDEEISMLGEVIHLQTISEDLKGLTSDPHKLPPASEQVILDLKGSDCGWSYQTPPSSPSTTMSRKSSMCSSTLPQQAPARLSSISSHDSGFISSSQDQNTSSKSSSPMPAETKPCPSSSSSEMSETGQLLNDCSSPSYVAAAAAAAASQHGTDELSNGFDHHSPATSPYLCSNGGSLGSASGTAFPFFPPSSSTTSTSCPARSWSRPASALLPDYTPYCSVGSTLFPSSKVPSWKDWAKPGPYDQPMVNTLRRKKDKETPALVDNNGTVNGGNAPLLGQTSTSAPPPAALQSPSQSEEKNRIMSTPLKVVDMEAHEELALALSRGLELDTQRSSRDSIQCSSGYSTQTNTPCCSEDTIPSQVSDYDYFSMAGDQEPEQQQTSDFDKSSTIPRNSDIGQSYRRMFQTKRPASTAGLPSTHAPFPGQGTYYVGPYPSTPGHTGAYSSIPTGHSPVIVTPGVATIRRTPSSKPSARRSGSVGAGPIPIRTPVVPVKTPTVPDVPATVNGNRSAEEVGAGQESPGSTTFTGPENGGALPVESWRGQASTNPPSVPLPSHQQQGEGEDAGDQEQGDMLVAIRKGVKLKRAPTNDRSAPRMA